MQNAGSFTNRLVHETSPYLLQHANNPVDWYPWGAEALAKAQTEDKPIFLSIGYSTCHWCHEMAHNTFEDPQVAAVLNADFVAIKVDREQRPDLDAVYMAVCQGLTGQGGWPLNVLTTPAQEPFWAGTYLPPQQLVQLLQQTKRLWREERAQLQANARRISAHFQEQARAQAAPRPGQDLAAAAFAQLAEGYDARYGGFGGAPKFPLGHNLLFLLAFGAQQGQGEALEMACRTLEMLYRGGIYDHVGGGFARYATDERWLIPHFEKMLYDNALLLLAYAEAYQLSGRAEFRRVAAETVRRLEREMRAPEGAFYAAQDADSEGGEGAYYLWRKAEIDALLGPQAAVWNARFGVTEAGNFEHANILHLLDCADWQNEPADLAASKELLYRQRRQRLPLHTDDKLLTAWNGLLIAALARAGRLLKEPHYLELAAAAWRYLARHAWTDGGRVLTGLRQGQSLGPGFLDDHAYLLWGLTELYQARQAPAPELLQAAQGLARVLHTHFYEAGAFYLTAQDAEPLLFRPREFYDGALPSGNVVAAYALLQLSQISGRTEWRALAETTLAEISAQAQAYPAGHCFGVLALLKSRY